MHRRALASTLLCRSSLAVLSLVMRAAACSCGANPAQNPLLLRGLRTPSFCEGSTPLGRLLQGLAPKTPEGPSGLVHGRSAPHVPHTDLRPRRSPSYPHPSHPHPSYPHPSHPHPSYPHPAHPHPSHPHPSHPHPAPAHPHGDTSLPATIVLIALRRVRGTFNSCCCAARRSCMGRHIHEEILPIHVARGIA